MLAVQRTAACCEEEVEGLLQNFEMVEAAVLRWSSRPETEAEQQILLWELHLLLPAESLAVVAGVEERSLQVMDGKEALALQNARICQHLQLEEAL